MGALTWAMEELVGEEERNELIGPLARCVVDWV